MPTFLKRAPVVLTPAQQLARDLERYKQQDNPVRFKKPTTLRKAQGKRKHNVTTAPERRDPKCRDIFAIN